MIIETYVATLKHDKGKIRLRVTSLSGKQGARAQIMAAEHCPERAIIKMKKIHSKTV